MCIRDRLKNRAISVKIPISVFKKKYRKRDYAYVEESLTLSMFIGLFGGLGMFIYGMHLMSEGLKIVAGNKTVSSTHLKQQHC